MRILTLIVGLLAPLSVHAVRLTEYGFDCTGFLHCGTGMDAVFGLSLSMIDIVATFIVALAVIVFMYGGLRMATSRGEEGKEAGKKALIYASLGLVFALLTAAIIDFISDYLYALGAGG
ncbi:MAG: pilin [Candidatus Peribacteraceae bacterium]